MSYSKLRDQKTADEYLGSMSKCRMCSNMEDARSAQDQGGMCRACFAHYCDPAPSQSKLTLDEKRAIIARLRGIMKPSADPGKQCADALRARRIRLGNLGAAQLAQLAALERIGK